MMAQASWITIVSSASRRHPSLRWNTGIQAATLVGHTAGSTLLCSICREPDHSIIYFN